MGLNRNIFKELLAALIGAGITAGLQLLFLLRPGADLDWRSITLSAITGAVIGWGYRLATELRTASDRALRELGDVVEEALTRLGDVEEQALTRLERTTQALDVQQETLQLLLSARIHKEVIWKLVSAALERDYRALAYISNSRYLYFLRSAISASDKSTGVKRAPVRSYKRDDDDVTETYLRTLRDKPMEKKIRIFIIDSEHEQDMKDDLDNSELMNYYWEVAGEDVENYWITTPEFRRNFARREVPNEFAIYDDELLIEYDELKSTLIFSIIKQGDSRLKIFEELAEQERNDLQGPFRKIIPPSDTG